MMVTERASEMAKLIGCLQPAEPGKHPKKLCLAIFYKLMVTERASEMALVW